MSTLRKQLYHYWKRLSERQARTKFTRNFFNKDIERFNTCTDKKPAQQIKQEMKALQQYWSCYPFQYYRHDLYRSDCPLTVEEMKKYVPLFFFNHLFFPLSYKDYDVLCEDKLLTAAMLNAYDIPQPKLLFCYDHHTFYDAENNPIAPEAVDTLIRNAKAEKLFAKTRFGSEGKGIFVFSKAHNGSYTDGDGIAFSNRFFTEDSRVKSIEGRDTSGFFIVQEGLVQHDAMNRIYPHAINTFRVITECTNGHSKVLYALTRFGQGGSQVDNASSGGMYIKLDPESGILGDFAYTTNRSTYKVHPDTGFVFKDAQITEWQQVKRFALQVAGKFREIKYLGWDIALTTDGPSVIEVNHHPDFHLIQDCYGGVRDDLKIHPKDWWYKSNYTIKNL